jgi:hypothetical protein
MFSLWVDLVQWSAQKPFLKSLSLFLPDFELYGLASRGICKSVMEAISFLVLGEFREHRKTP